MSIILFALIGHTINANSIYWICYGVFCVITLIKAFVKLMTFGDNAEW